ncbi:MAG TPA: alpha/beta hydrolase [Pirellulales bacterium]
MTDEPAVRETFRTVNGLRLQVAEAGPLDGPLVILLHGFPDVWQNWRLQIAPLVAAGFRVLAPNQRGYGKSDKPTSLRAYNLDVLAADVDSLAATEGRMRYHLVGHDWGGIIAWWAAAKYPHRVAKLVACNAPHPGAFSRYLWRHPTQMLKSYYVGAFQLPWLPEMLLSAGGFRRLQTAVAAMARPDAFDETDRAARLAAWAEPGALTGMINYYRAALRRAPTSLSVRVTVPTLIVWGKRDKALEFGSAIESEKLADDVRLVEFAEAGHWVQHEETARVNAEMLTFLRGN